jgi:hypothetical protein
MSRKSKFLECTKLLRKNGRDNAPFGGLSRLNECLCSGVLSVSGLFEGKSWLLE